VHAIQRSRDPTDTRPRYAWGNVASDLTSLRGVAPPQNADAMNGPQLYDAWCPTCHQVDARGSFDGGLPPLVHNTALGQPSSDNLDARHARGSIHRRVTFDELRSPRLTQCCS